MKRRVLVVEDNAANLELLCDWLELEGHQPLVATGLKAAMEVIAGEKPEVVLLDVQLGEEDGLHLAEWIRREPAFLHLPVIAVTAHALIAERERILHSGCNAFVAKPLDFKLLREKLALWLRTSTKVEKAGQRGFRR